jgi:signal transduction histidine kinase
MNAFLKKRKQNINRSLPPEEADEFLDLLDEGIVIFNENLDITYANKKALDLLQNTDLQKRFYKKTFSICKKLVFFSYKENTIYKETVLEESSKFYLNISAIPRKNKKGVFLIFKDKTSDYKMLTMGRDFVANASHELRTPLTIIKGFSETLGDYAKLSEKTIISIVQTIIKTSKRLERIISDLLTLANIENIHYKSFSLCDLKQVIRNCKEMILLAHIDVNIEENFSEESFFVLGDSGLLEMAIKNLLENAVKYSKNNPNISLFLRKDKNKIYFKVQDNGIGIPEKDLPFIFDRFFTVDKARSRKYGGAGLGLSLVKNIFEKHQGTIEVSSELNKGSGFEIKLPLFLE